MTIQSRIWLGFSITLMFFVVAALMGNYTSKQIRLSEQWVTHTNEVLTALEALISVVKDAETGHRGYLLTSKEDYLEPYISALSNAPVRLQELKELIDDNPQQQRRVAQIMMLVNLKLEELGETIELHRSGKTEAALALVLTNKGKQIMGEIRVGTKETLVVENTLLKNRITESNRIVMLSKWIVYGGSFLILLMASLVAYLTSRSISKEYTQLQLTEKSLFTANQALMLKTTQLEQSNEEISTFEYRVEKEKEKIYVATIHGAQHVTNNLLNQLMIVQREIEKNPQFDKNISSLFDVMLAEARSLMVDLSSVHEIEDETIRQSIQPK